MNEAAPTLPFPTHDMLSQGRSAPPLNLPSMEAPQPGPAVILRQIREDIVFLRNQQATVERILDQVRKDIAFLRAQPVQAGCDPEAEAIADGPSVVPLKVNRRMVQVSLSGLLEIFGVDKIFGARDLLGYLEKDKDQGMLAGHMQKALGGALKLTTRGMLVFLRRGAGLTTMEGEHIMRSQSVCKTRVFWFEPTDRMDPLS